MRQGVKSLNETELLAVLLQTGTKEESVLVLAQRILEKFSLEQLTHSSIEELTEMKGIGFAKACKILSAFEITRRIKLERKIRIQSAKGVYEYAREMSLLEQEKVRLLILDAKHQIKKDIIVYVGTLNGSMIHPRELFRLAIKEGAFAIILLHNHPSGDANPSSEDEKVTEQLQDVARIMGIQLLDHIIIGREEYYSFSEAKKIVCQD